MNALTIVALQCILAGLLQSSPVPNSISNAKFIVAVDSANALVEKLLKYIPVAHRSTIENAGLTLVSASQPTDLQLMKIALHIPASPVLKSISGSFTMEQCVSRIFEGVQLYYDLTDALLTKYDALLTKYGALQAIHVDLRDLRQQITQMQIQRGLGNVDPYQRPDLASHLTEDYKVEVATHLMLVQLRFFCLDMIRSLQQIKALST